MAFEVLSDLDPATEAALHTKKKGKHSQALWYTVTSDLSDGALPMIQLELLSFLVYHPLWFPRWGHRWGLVPTWPWNLTGFIICRLSLFSLLCKSSFCKKNPSGWAHLQGILMTHERSFWFAFYEEIRSTLLIPRRRKRNRSLWTCRADGREADYTTWWRNSCGCFDSFPLFFFFFLTFHRGGLSLLESILTEWVQAAVLWLWGKQMNSYLFELTGGESASMFTVQSQLQNCRGQHIHRLLLKRLFAVASFGCSN